MSYYFNRKEQTLKEHKVLSHESAKNSLSLNKDTKINLAYECIDKHAQGKSKYKKALICISKNNTVELTFNELKNYTDQFATFLLKNGLNKGEKVLLWMPRIAELYIALMGIIKAGGVPVPLSEFLSSRLVLEILEKTPWEKAYMVTTHDFLSTLSNLPEKYKIVVINRADDFPDTSILSFKIMEDYAVDKDSVNGANFSDELIVHYALDNFKNPRTMTYKQNQIMLMRHFGELIFNNIREEDVFWSTVDLGWAAGTLYGIFTPWIFGATIVSADTTSTLSSWEKTIEKYKVNIMYTTPAMIRKIITKNITKTGNLKTLRHICCTGEPMGAEIIKWVLKNLRIPINSSWFAEEIGVPAISSTFTSPLRLGCMGKPLPGIEAAVFDDKGNQLKPYQIGKLGIRCSFENHTYDENSTAEKTSWVLTDCLAYIDNEGCFWYEGKEESLKKSISKADNLNESQLEAHLLKHPAVEEAGIIVKSREEGEKAVKVFISLKDRNQWSTELERELTNYLQKKLKNETTKIEIEIRDKLPMTKSGKILRNILSAWDRESSLRRVNNF
ncbi:MAG TPA: hypothetical protein DEA47_05410 [Peptococcaceae bacterium]|nr:MAG: acetyl-CoA synthetase [Clostridia bacterium 41_269]HBT20781.1 hypothetical protein [Peptococcaceae bacterium]